MSSSPCLSSTPLTPTIPYHPSPLFLGLIGIKETFVWPADSCGLHFQSFWYSMSRWNLQKNKILPSLTNQPVSWCRWSSDILHKHCPWVMKSLQIQWFLVQLHQHHSGVHQTCRMSGCSSPGLLKQNLHFNKTWWPQKYSGLKSFDISQTKEKKYLFPFCM